MQGLRPASRAGRASSHNHNRKAQAIKHVCVRVRVRVRVCARAHLCSVLLTLSTVTSVKGVASPSCPTSDATLDMSASTR